MLTYFDVYADAYRRGVMTEGQLVSAVRLGRITLPQAREIVATGGKCGALWTPPAPEPTPPVVSEPAVQTPEAAGIPSDKPTSEPETSTGS